MQGSVLGPVVFILYVQLLSDIISIHDCFYHKCTDDTELPKNAHHLHFFSALTGIENYITDVLYYCITDVLAQMTRNKFKY